MSHYGYADARPMLVELGYAPILYTAQNVESLSADLKRLKLHAVVFASNALNDKTIRDAIVSDASVKAFREFLAAGQGCLILHQLRLAQDKVALSFLPQPLDRATPMDRAPKEKASDGDLLPTEAGRSHVTFLYPNKIDVAEVKSRCLSYGSLKGLYWHFWDKVSRADWDVLLLDTDRTGEERPLVIVSKESQSYRIVACSLTLDWQKQKKMLKNMLTYVVEGRHHTAIVKDPQTVSAPFEYFLECLRSQEYPFQIYEIGRNLSDLAENVSHGVHTIIVLDPFTNESRLGTNVYSAIQERVKEGRAKLIGINQEVDVKKFYVAGGERYALRLIHDLELKIQKELREGYIDGSFWSTVESLQILHEIPYVGSKYSRQTLDEVFKKTQNHDRDGSYDEVFGVTCALLWLRATYLGKDHSDTLRTLAWIRKNLPDYEARERTLAYHTMINVGLADLGERESLRNILLAQQVDHLSEIDLVVYLRAAVAGEVKDVFIPIVQRLEDLQRDGCWIDLATSATAVSALLDVRSILERESAALYPKISRSLQSMLFKTVIYLQNSKERSSGRTVYVYPWDNKASTSLKCIEAWARFEELIDIPIHEVIDTLKSYSAIETDRSSAKTALTILEELKNENRGLVEERNRLQATMAGVRKRLNASRYLWIPLTLLLYFLATVGITTLVVGVDTPTRQVLLDAFPRHWPVHFGVIGLPGTILGILWYWSTIRKEGKKSNADQ